MQLETFIIEFACGVVFGGAAVYLFRRRAFENIVRAALIDMKMARDYIHRLEERNFHLAVTLNKWRPARGERGRFVRAGKS